MTFSGFSVSFWDDENVLKLDSDMVVQLCEYTKNHWIVHFKRMNCMASELYLNKTIIKKKQ